MKQLKELKDISWQELKTNIGKTINYKYKGQHETAFIEKCSNWERHFIKFKIQNCTTFEFYNQQDYEEQLEMLYLEF